jgi:cupin fold WbuC family metalloprotein
MLTSINQNLLDELTAKARTAPRLRMNHNFHQSADDPLNRMLNAMEPGTYVRPHKHENPDKREAFLLLRGRILVVSFDETGSVADYVELNPAIGNFGLEIAPRTYHTLITLESGSVLYELKDGPYDVQNDKQFAPWAPEEGSPEAPAYAEQILRKITAVA